MTERTLGIIGGSGLYDLPGIEGREEHRLETPFGSMSGSYQMVTENGETFDARIAPFHLSQPHAIN